MMLYQLIMKRRKAERNVTPFFACNVRASIDGSIAVQFFKASLNFWKNSDACQAFGLTNVWFTHQLSRYAHKVATPG